MNKKTIAIQAMDGSIKIIKNVEKTYMIGQNILVVCGCDGSETYYTNYKLVSEATK